MARRLKLPNLAERVFRTAVYAGIAAFFHAAAALASDSEARLLDTLVERGVLSQEESLEIKKSNAAAPEISPSAPETRIRLFNFIHARYQYSKQTYSSGESFEKSGFAVRRLIPVVLADVSRNSKIQVSLFFPSRAPLNASHYEYNVDTEYLSGKFWLGYETAFFCMEEPESGTRIMTPDRSILNMYFGGGDHGFYGGNSTSYSTPLAFSGYHTGVFWNGNLAKNKSVIYRFAVTNSKAEKVGFGGDNGYAFWTALGIDKADGTNRLRLGVNGGYSTRVVSAVSEASVPSPVADFGDAWGVNPYLLLRRGAFSLDAEFMAVALQYGSSTDPERAHYSTSSKQAAPWGFYVLAAYKFDIPPFGQFEPVFRYLHLDTDGRGVTEGAVLYRTENRGGLFDKIDAFYAGVNWYVLGNNLKYTFCVEYADFNEGVSGGSDRNSGTLLAMVQVQIVF